MGDADSAALASVFREEAGRICAALVRVLGDFDLAEDAVQDAILTALQTWPRDGVPANPGAWLTTTARNRALDRVRRERRGRDKLALLEAAPASPAPHTTEMDDRLRLIFTCCHPALSREAQVALTLRAVVGLTTEQIARAFLVSEATMAQRIVRAKRKIVAANIPYRIPAGDDVEARLDEVLSVLYLMFNEGYLSSGGEAAARHDLVDDADWLAGLLTLLMPGQAETSGLHALIRIHRARAAARFDTAGNLVLLRDQDRALWDHAAIADAVALLSNAARTGTPGRFWIEAAIAACHAEAPHWEDTDWPQIVALYDALLRISASPVVGLNRAIASSHVDGAAEALDQVDALRPALDGYHLFHATRAELLRTLGRTEEARAADRVALALTANPAERSLLASRLDDPETSA